MPTQIREWGPSRRFLYGRPGDGSHGGQAHPPDSSVRSRRSFALSQLGAATVGSSTPRHENACARDPRCGSDTAIHVDGLAADEGCEVAGEEDCDTGYTGRPPEPAEGDRVLDPAAGLGRHG